MSLLSPKVTLGEAKQWLRDRLGRGDHCPCCGQFAKVYDRRINAAMAQALIAMYQTAGRDWVHMPTLLNRKQHDDAKLRYWGLIEEATEPRPDGGRAGWWRLTEDGVRFVLGAHRVPKIAQIYDGRCLGFDGPLVGIHECLGERFSYAELMGRAA